MIARARISGHSARLLLTLAGLFAAAAGSAGAQETAQDVFSRPRKLSLAPDRPIELQFEFISKDDWIALSGRESPDSLFIQVSQLAPVDIQRGGGLMPPLAPLDVDSLIAQQGNRLFIGRKGGGAPICVYVEAPQNSSVPILNGSSPIYEGTPDTGLLVAGLKVTRRSISRLDLIDLVIRSRFPAHARQGQSPTDPYTVAFDLVKGKMRKYVQPPFEAGSGPVLERILVELVVAADGSVSDVILRRGPREYFDGARAAASQWEFEPFVVDGRSVAFRTMTFLNVRR